MSEFLRDIQSDILSTARDAYGADWSVGALQSALVNVRMAYGNKVGPDFSSSENRLAYALASHPYHALMSYEVLSQCTHLLHGRVAGEFTAVVLGAGPGAEAIALVRLLAARFPDLRKITLTLVDKEAGWERTRETTIHRTSRRWWSGELEVRHVVADLATESGRQAAGAVLTLADLVIAQALLTEITTGTDSVRLLADLVTRFSADSLLLLCDFTNMRGLNEWIPELDAIESLRTVAALQERFPMPSCHPDVKPLYANEPYLRERGQVTVTARLYSRPGWRPPEIQVDSDFVPTEGQQNAIDSFRSFLTSEADSFILEGPAGTGKTEIMRQMASIATSAGMSVSLWAPTGQAAVRLSTRTGLPAGTIHASLFERTGRRDNDTDERDWPPTIVFKRRSLDYSDHVVFIDEASMIGDQVETEENEPPELKFEDGRLLTQIIEGVVRKGGKVVFVGDACQLPPIREQSAVALNREYLTSRGCTVVGAQLSEVRRTRSDSEILDLSMKLRSHVLAGDDGLMPYEPQSTGDVSMVKSFQLEPYLVEQFKAGHAVALATRNVDVSYANGLIRESIGRHSELPEPDDRLVLVKGNQILGLMNGTDVRADDLVGNVVEVKLRDRHTAEEKTVQLQKVLMSMSLPSGDVLDFESTIVVDALGAPDRDLLARVRQVLWVNFTMRMRKMGIKKNQEVFWQLYEADESANALLCSYSYARTLYRAQGGEWRSVIVDGHSLMPIRPGSSRQAYSAVTRAREALYLRGWPRQSRPSRTYEDLAEVPKSILQRALEKAVSVRRLEQASTTTVQLSADVGESKVLVNVYDSARGPTVHIEAAAPQDRQLFEKQLQAWSKFEAVRDRHEVPTRIEEGVRRLESLLADDGVDLVVVRPGNGSRNVEFHAFQGNNFASFRGTWTDEKGLNAATFKHFGSNSESLRDLILQSVARVFSS